MITISKYQQCSNCGGWFPPTLEFFHRSKTSIRGLRKECKECRNAKVRKHNKQYWKDNKKDITIKRTIYKRERYKNNPMFKLNVCISAAIRGSLYNSSKNGHHWEGLVGYTLQDLREHLESQFQSGMTWDNHGIHGWHIDHIIPKASFNFITYEDPEFLKCWALDNLQPLWAEDNLRKGTKVQP